MPRLLISYDLRKPDYDYDPLYEDLNAIDAKHIQDSVWAIQTDDTPEQIYDHLWPYLYSDKDRLLVVGINGFKAINSITQIPSVSEPI
jgi:hypothetical protein